MRLLRVILASLLLAGGPISICLGADAGPAMTNSSPAEAGATQEEHGLPKRALEIARPVGGFPITNSMIVTWIVAVGLIAFAQLATRNMKEVPDGAQNFWEWLVEGLHGFLSEIVGADLVKRTFWFF